jgi:hypothetical protein
MQGGVGQVAGIRTERTSNSAQKLMTRTNPKVSATTAHQRFGRGQVYQLLGFIRCAQSSHGHDEGARGAHTSALFPAAMMITWCVCR